MATLYAVAQSVDARHRASTPPTSPRTGSATAPSTATAPGAFSPLGHVHHRGGHRPGPRAGPAGAVPASSPPPTASPASTDEDNLGFSYHAVNEYVRKGVADPEIKEQIDQKHRASRFKFETIPVYHNGLPIVIEDGTDFYK